MKHDVFAKSLKIVIAGVTLIGLACCIYLIPFCGKYLIERYPEYSYVRLPWTIFIYVCSVPCFIAMGISWRIADNIGKDNSFSFENAKLFKIFSFLALGDSIFFLIVSVVFLFVGLNHPGILLASMLIVFAGLTVYVCTAALSYLVDKAATLQEDSDLTI